MINKIFSWILYIFLIGASFVTISIFVIVAPKVFSLMSQIDFTYETMIREKLKSFLSNGILLTFLLAMIILPISLFLIGIRWIYIALLSLTNLRAEKNIQKAKKYDEEIQKLLDQTEQINSNYYQLETYVKKTNSKLSNLRKSIRTVIKNLENDINGLIDYMSHQFKNSIPEVLAFFQVTVGNYLLEIAKPTLLEKIITLIFSISIFFISIWLKNPKIKYSTSIILLSILQLPIIFSGFYINKNESILNFNGIYYWISIVVYIVLIIQIYNNKDRVIERVKLRKI